MNQRGPYAFAQDTLAWLFDASCDGGANSFEIRVHGDFTEAEAASAAQEYGKAAGRLPKVLRSGIGAATGVRILSIHKGSHSWAVSNWSGHIRIYTEFAQGKYDEEILVHEAAHVALDRKIKSDSRWPAAQKADGAFVSKYAKSNPQREDVAESFLAYFSARYVPSRISEAWKATILQTIPNRIAYFDALLSTGDMKPFARASLRVAADNPVSLSVSGNGAAAEGGPVLTVTATLGTANATGAALAIPVRVRAAGTTATATDYTLAGTISIPDGGNSGTTGFAVVDDGDDEPEETVVVEMGSPLPSGIAAGATDRVTIAIADNDDPAPVAKGCVSAALLTEVEERIRTNDAARWTRVLKALKQENGGIPLAEVKEIHDRRARNGWSTAQWAPVVAALACLKGSGDTAPLVAVTGGNAISEGGTASFTLTASPAPAAALTVALTVDRNGDFAAGGETGARTVTVPTGGSVTVDVATLDDSVDEPDGSVSVTVDAGTGYTPSDTNGAASVAVADNDATGVTLSAPSGDVAEAGGRKVLTVALGRGLAQGEALTAPLVLGGAATPGSDYVLSAPAMRPQGVSYANLASADPAAPPAVTFAGPSASSAMLILTAAADAAAEGSGEAVTVGLGTLGVTGLGGGAEGSGTVSFAILEPPPEISIAAKAASITEGVDAAFTVTASRAPGADLAVSLVVSEAAGSDMVATENEGAATVTIAKGETEAVFAVATVNDGANEPDGSASVTVDAGEGYSVAAGQASAAVAVSDDDEPELSISAGVGGTEGGAVEFTLVADPAPASPLAVALTVGQDGDYLAAAERGRREVTVPTSGSVTVTVPTVDDDTDEPNGSVTAALEAGSGYTLGALSVIALDVVDNDDPAPMRLNDDPAALITGIDGAIAFQQARDNPSHNAIERWTRIRTALTAESVSDALLAEVRAWLEKQRAANGRYLALGERVWAALNGMAAPAPEVSVSAGGAVTEGGDAVFTVTASPAPKAALTVALTVDDDAAADFLAAGDEGSRTVVIPAGQSSAGLTLATVNDGADEPDGAVTATAAQGTGYRIGSPDTASVAVSDDDAPAPVPEVSVSAGNTIAEGGDASFTVTASPAPAADLAVTVRIGGTDGVAALSVLGERTVTLAGGAASKTFSIATVDDAVDGPGGAVTATVVAGTGYAGDGSSATVAVSDDDATVATLSAPPGDVAEANGRKVLTVALWRALVQGEALTAPLVLGGAATPGSDYTLSAPAPRPQGVTYANLAGPGTPTLTFTGPSASSATLSLIAATDSTAEGAGETVTVGLGTVSATGLDGGAESSGSAGFSILEPPPEIAIAAKAGSVTEGAEAAFTVTASRAVAADLSVSLAVSEAAGSDFVAAGNEGAASVTILKGGTEASFTVPTVDDAADEPNGTVTATIAGDGEGGARYTVAAAPKDAASVKVTDDDTAPTVPALSVVDATAHENERLMRFTVRLSPTSDKPVWVYFRTRESRPASAREGMDYLELGTSVRFKPGETEKEAMVYIFDDSHDEDPETFELVLSHRSGAPIVDGVAVGTIVNSDPMPAAWLSRFGRTVAEQALDGIASRMAAPRTPGAQGTFAGQALSFGGTGPDAPGDAANDDAAPGGGRLALSGFDRPADRFGTGGSGHDAHGPGSGPGQAFGQDRFGSSGAQAWSMTAREALLGSSFTATGEKDGTGGSLAFWGRAAQSSFDGREGTFSLDGEATTAMLGADYARGNWLVGLALMQSAGEGGYVDRKTGPQGCPDGAGPALCDMAVRAGDGKVEATLAAAVPYAAIQTSERLKLWGTAGHGTGEVTLRPETSETSRPLTSDISWTMAAMGLRGDVVAPQGSGPALAVTSDALWARTSSDKTHELAASDSDVTRLRLGLEGSWRAALAGGGHPGSGSGASLTPKLEIGMRHDGGDAETGFGVELGGGLAWVDPALGLSLDLSGRTLIAHGSDDLEDRGFAASLAFDPDPATKRGPSLTLTQDWGGQAKGGLDALFTPETLDRRGGSDAATARWQAEAAYGFPAFSGRFTGSPHMGLGLATGARDYSLGWRLTPARNAPDVSFGVRATRRESDAAAPEHAVGLEINARW